MARQLIGVSETARRLGISAVRIRQLADKGTLPVAHRTLDRTRFFDPAVIERVRKARAARQAKKTTRTQVAVNQ